MHSQRPRYQSQSVRIMHANIAHMLGIFISAMHFQERCLHRDGKTKTCHLAVLLFYVAD